MPTSPVVPYIPDNDSWDNEHITQNSKLVPVNIYKNASIRMVSVLFGSFFNNLRVRNYTKEGLIDTTDRIVPLQYAAKSSVGIWLDQKLRSIGTPLEIGRIFPRMAFELKSLERDSDFQLNPQAFNLRASTDTTSTFNGRRLRMPVAYKFGFDLTLWTSDMDTTIQILDQIIPYFVPEMTIKIKEFPDLNIVDDVKIVLESVDKDDNYQEQFQKNRIIEWTLGFSLYANIVPTEKATKLINQVLVNMETDTNQTLQQYLITGHDPDYMDTTKITTEIIENPDDMIDFTVNNSGQIGA